MTDMFISHTGDDGIPDILAAMNEEDAVATDKAADAAADEIIADYDREEEDADEELASEEIDDNAETLEQEQAEHFNKISKMYIKDSTREGYNSSNRAFLLWLDQKHPECVSTAAKTDLEQTFRSRRAATAKHKNREVGAKALELVRNADSEANCPVIFGNVTVKIFIDFLFSRAQARGRKFLSKSGCGSYRSAFKELHRQSKVRVDPDFEADLTVKFKGLLRGYAKEKELTGGRLTEGKDPMTFALYRFLCKKMVEDGGKTAIFSHAFLTTTWNLMCRSKNTVHIHLNHITWGSDSMMIRFAHTKTDVEGGDQARIRHVFANPYNLDICAVTALAKYLASFPPKKSGKVFDNGSYKRFQKYLKGLVLANRAEIERMGFCPEDIGVHSIRKGSAMYCCGGTTAAPHIAAICNRAGWTMGKVKDTYIQYAEAGDQHVGRVVAGLPVLSAKYACSPPFFREDNGNNPIVNTCTSEDIDFAIATLFPSFQSTITFKPVAITCAAALLRARQYLDKTMPER